jgi:hypothetical protein
MLGKDVNRMEIKAVDLCNKRVYDLWSKKGGLDDEWNYAEVNINISSRYGLGRFLFFFCSLLSA